MSAKWRALQHRHRYTYTAAVFPPSYLDHLPPGAAPPTFAAELRSLASLTTIYAQVHAVKRLAAAFADFLAAPGAEPAAVVAVSRAYLGILFLENSLPLHRTVIAALAKSRRFMPEVCAAFRLLCGEFGEGGGKGRRFLVCRAALSVLGYPKLGAMAEVVGECAVLVARDVVTAMGGVVAEVDGGARLSPVVMEQCQEAMSCLYYLLQRFPSKFEAKGSGGILDGVIDVIVRVLKSSSFSRDCVVAAGVSFFAALQVCAGVEELAFFIVKAFFFCSDGSGRSISPINGFSEGLKMRYSGDLCLEVRNLSALSKLCLLRGMLTAVPRTVLNMHFVVTELGVTGSSVWSILYEGILSELCGYCENPIDSHFNFHALTVTQICLQQIKASLLANLTDTSGGYDPLSDAVANRLLRIIWNNLEDPLNQTVKQVHLVFDLLLDSLPTLQTLKGSKSGPFLQVTAGHLLKLGARCKGRYVPLASITKRLGANAMLQLNSNLLFETAHAYIDDDVCCAATSFLKCFLECLLDECWSAEGIAKGYVTFRTLCLPPILYGLVSGRSKLRTNLNIYALPALLDVDVDCIFPMLAFISVRPSEKDKEISYLELPGEYASLKVDQNVAALVSLLKVARSTALIDGDIEMFDDLIPHDNGHKFSTVIDMAIICVKGINLNIPVEWLILALTHEDESLRIDAAESLFLNPKTASLPSLLELRLMKEAVPLNMRCCSTAFQMKWTSLFRKFFSRVRTALERQIKLGLWSPNSCVEGSEHPLDNEKKIEVRRAENLFGFMKWLTCFLFFSCYPSAPYERKTMATELILTILGTWPLTLHSQAKKDAGISPYTAGFLLPDSTLLLVGSVVDSWDRLRENSFRILSHFPTPLPGLSSEDSIKEIIAWAKKLVCSPRVRESDAGALTLRLVFRKYVLDLGWVIGVSAEIYCAIPQVPGGLSRIPVIEYLLSLVDWLRILVEDAENDLSRSCRNSFVHGVLLTLRYTFEELDWNSEGIMSNSSLMRLVLGELLNLVRRITAIALWVVSADAWYFPEEMDALDDDATFFSDVASETFVPDESTLENINGSRVIHDTRPAADQVVMVGCWLAMKEVSLLLGTIIRKVPLPAGEQDCEGVSPVHTVLDVTQLETIGSHFLEVILKMKHNGAIDKTRAGFTALCNRLLCSNEPSLCSMIESWMDQLMDRTVSKGQTVDDLLRRSAGIPAAFVAFFLSEPEGTPKKLLPRALRWLIDVANLPLPYAGQDNGVDEEEICKDSLQEMNKITKKSGTDVESGRSKFRDEGVIPTVHAFNVLRAAFNDANLAADTSGFCAEALIVAIRSFSSPYWEIRNSACLAFTALVRRMIGFLNVQKRESARRALTGLEFFHRYPALHPFLLKELEVAAESLTSGHSENSQNDIAKAVHPSLCPILILLSRLKPSVASGETEDSLDPFLFMPFIWKCSIQNNFRVRVLASRAVLGLVSNEMLGAVLLTIAKGLPQRRCTTETICFYESKDGGENETESFASFNSIHGLLLQLGSLLDNNCRNLVDTSEKSLMIGGLTDVLLKCSWIGCSQFCPCPTLNASYLQVLSHMLSISRTCEPSHYVSVIGNILLDLSSKCIEKEVSLVSYDPTISELRSRAVVFYFKCICATYGKEYEDECLMQMHIRQATALLDEPNCEITVDDLGGKIVSCISDTAYEVRLETLKWLFKSLESNFSTLVTNNASLCTWAETSLQSTLMKFLDVEKHPKCLYYILRLIYFWNFVQLKDLNNQVSQGIVSVGNLNYDDTYQLWGKLVSLNKVVKHAKTLEMILRCMGICARRFAFLLRDDLSSKGHMPETWSTTIDCLKNFIFLVKKHSLPSEPVNMRKAAAEAMVASGLLEEARIVGPLTTSSSDVLEEARVGSMWNSKSSDENLNPVELYACGILDLWFSCIKLLEDEDVALRQGLALSLQQCINSSAASVPSQVEKVIDSIFCYISLHFGHWIEYLKCLLRFVMDTGGFVLVKGDLVRRVFDKEIDNHHEEKLLVCQLCCLQLSKLSSFKSLVNIGDFVELWRTRFLQQLNTFIKEYVELGGGNDWIGGLGNHKNVFMSSYANLLGLYALSQKPFDTVPSKDTESGIFLSEFVELTEIIQPLLTNPLISNLYFVVIQSYRRLFGPTWITLEVKSLGKWENFHPFFLLQ